MKDTVWLHIGTHKTGTTAIQSSLSRYDDGNIRYARLGLPNHSIPLETVFRGNPEQNGNLRKKGITGAAAHAYAAEVRRKLQAELDGPARVLILSGETLSLFSTGQMRNLKAAIEGSCREIRVLAYVRDPITFASSIFAERIRNGGHQFALPDLGYRTRLEPSIQIFGRDAVEVVRYDRRHLRNGDVIDHFAHRTGVNRTRLAAPRGNERLPARAAAALYFWNRTGDAVVNSRSRLRARNEMIRALAVAMPGVLRLAPDLIRKSVDPGDVAWLAETFGIDFAPELAAAKPGPDDIAGEDDLRRLRDEALPELRRIGGRFRRADPDALVSAVFARKLRLEHVKQPLRWARLQLPFRLRG